MPRLAFKTCKNCGRGTDEAGPLSWTRLCLDCAKHNVSENVGQMMERRGPNWSKWRHAMAACVGGAIVDEHDDQA